MLAQRIIAAVLCLLAAAGTGAWAGQDGTPADDGPLRRYSTLDNVVIAGNVRFSVLSQSLIRLEYDPDAAFVDAPSLVAAYRSDPELVEQVRGARLRVQEDAGSIEIITDLLHLRYRARSGSFGPRNLEITVKDDDREITWKPGDPAVNLGGTAATLREARGPVGLGEGVLTRSGYYLLDDSRTPIFTRDGWLQPRAGLIRQDLYFFGYGGDYARALSDLNLLVGRMPMPPRWAFGLWLMCDWPLRADELLNLVRAFDERNIPLEALLISRWSRNGWTSYDWDRRLFPDPQAFLDEAHKLGVRVGLLIHPGGALLPQDSRYAQAIELIGWDPRRRNRAFFDVSNRTEAEALTRILLEPLEKQGVDFWWADSPAATTMRWLGDQWWTNFLLFDRSRLPEGKRGLILAPYGGLGSNRFPAGFSGMPRPSWETLEFLTHYTATAGNVGMAYWANVINACRDGRVDSELFSRWLQFGLFSPIMVLRTRNGDVGWLFDEKTAQQAFRLLRFRRRMGAYLYTLARQVRSEGLPLVRPMYLHYPREEDAYRAKHQFMLGRDIIAAPVVRPSGGAEVRVSRKVWFPPGEWQDVFTGRIVQGPALLSYPSALDAAPMFARSGAILPAQDNDPRHLTIDIYSGESGEFQLYADDGDTTAYEDGACALCTVQYLEGESVRIVRIGPWEGSYDGEPTAISYEVRLHTFLPPLGVAVNGESPPPDGDQRKLPWWSYDVARSRITVRTRPQPTNAPVELVFAGDFTAASRVLAYRLREVVPRLESAAILLRENKGPASLINDLATIIAAAEAAAVEGGAIPFRKECLESEIDRIHLAMQEVVRLANEQVLNEQVKLEFIRVLTGISLESRIIPSPYRQVILRTEVRFLPTGWGELSGTLRVEKQPPQAITLLQPGDDVFFESSVAVDSILLRRLAFRVRADLAWNGVPLNLALEQTLDNTFIKQFYVIGPFGDGSYRRMTQVNFPPEREVTLDATYVGKKKMPVYWRKLPWQAPVEDCEGRDFRFVRLADALKPIPPAAGFAVTYVHVPRDVPAQLLIGGKSGVVVWVNETQVLSEPYMRFDRPDEVAVAVRLRSGWNRIRVKAVDEGGRWGFYLRIVGEDGRPIPGARSGWGGNEQD